MEEKVVNKENAGSPRSKAWTGFLAIAAVVVFVSVIAGFVHLRLDLTGDKRYTLSEPTKKILRELKNDIYIQVWLEGEMPVQFKKLKRSVKELLDEFRIASGRKLDYEFINPMEGKDQKEQAGQYENMVSSGLSPVRIQLRDEEGGSSQRTIFPGMTVNHNGAEIPVNFLKNNPALPPEQNLLHSVEGLEYEVIQTISTITADSIYRIAFIEGHNEIDENGVADITLNLAKYFTIDRGAINGRKGILDRYAAIIVAGPESEFNEADKYVLDQYIMKGGKVLWLFEEVKADMDSLVNGETIALYRPLGIEDQLFVYGARVNPAIVQDLESVIIPMKVIAPGSQQQTVPVPWLYYPLLYPNPGHPVTRNINRIEGRFVNYIDTVGRDNGIRKTVLLYTSRLTKTLNPPQLISLKEADRTPDEREFTRKNLPVAVLLEGTFRSSFRNRPVPAGVQGPSNGSINEVTNGKMIVIADGDIIRNDVKRTGKNITPYQLGLDRYTMQTYGNRDFIINCMNYLVDDDGLMHLRSRELKLRLLDKKKVKSNLLTIRLINVAAPVILVIVAGLAYNWFRRKKYASRS